jgi:hypothetical protein
MTRLGPLSHVGNEGRKEETNIINKVCIVVRVTLRPDSLFRRVLVYRTLRLWISVARCRGSSWKWERPGQLWRSERSLCGCQPTGHGWEKG